MPVNYTSMTTVVKTIDSYTCNCCGKTTNAVEDPLEAQEYLSLDWCGGYSSVFGDSVAYDLTLCQTCLKRMLGHYFINKETGKYFE